MVNIRNRPHEEPSAFVDRHQRGKLDDFRAPVADQFDRLDWILGIQLPCEMHLQGAGCDFQHLTGQRAVRREPQQEPVANNHPAGLETIPPAFPIQLTAGVDIHAIVADRVRHYAARTARAGWQAKSGVEGAEIEIMSPKPVAVNARVFHPITRAAPGLVIQHSTALHVVVSYADRVEFATRQPDREILPEGFFGIDPGSPLLCHLEEKTGERPLARLSLVAGKRKRLLETKHQQGSTTPFVSAGHDIIKATVFRVRERARRRRLARPCVRIVPPGSCLRDPEIFRFHQQRDLRAIPLNVSFSRPPSFRGHVHQTLHLQRN